MAVEQETYDLVRDQLATGKTEADIRPMLKQVGYSDVEMAEIFLHAKTHPVGTTPKQVQKLTYSEPVTPKPTAQKQYVPLGTPEPAVKSIPKPASKKPIAIYIGLIAIIVVALLGTFLFVLPMMGPEEIIIESGETADLGALTETDQTASAAEDSTILFDVDGDAHRAEIEEITEDTVTIAVFSEVHRITLRIGETKEIDLDGDGETDVSITLNAIEDGMARIQIRKMHREQKGNGEKNGTGNGQQPACTEGKKVNIECSGSDSMKFKECIEGQWVIDTELCPILTVYVENGYYEGYCENTECKTRKKCNSGHALENGQCVAEVVHVCDDGETHSCTTSEGCPGIKTCSNNAWGTCVDTAGDNCPTTAECTAGQTQSCTTTQGCPGMQGCSNNAWNPCADVPKDGCPYFMGTGGGTMQLGDTLVGACDSLTLELVEFKEGRFGYIPMIEIYNSTWSAGAYGAGAGSTIYAKIANNGYSEPICYAIHTIESSDTEATISYECGQESEICTL